MRQLLDYYNKNLNNNNKSLRQNLIHLDNIYSPSILQHIKLKWDILCVNNILLPYKHIYNLSWIIKFLDTKYNIENNYPHTHDDTIFFPSSFFKLSKKERISLLIHEKIHIYQRYYPIPYHKIILNYYDLQVVQLLDTHDDFEKIRQNPDNNQLIYSDQGQYTLPLFREDPSSISDVVFIDYNVHNKSTKYSKLKKNEHPNETFAYNLTDNILNHNVPKIIQDLI